MDFVVEGARPRGRPKGTWNEVVESDVKSLMINGIVSAVNGSD